MISQLENNSYECAICYQKIRANDAVWSCPTCYHLFHITSGCLTSWARSSKEREVDGCWRCPTCQSKNEIVPRDYYCFCGKLRNPKFRLGEIPHSCGDVCGRQRKLGCPHRCADICHPGPCTDCQQYVMKVCNCGKTRKRVLCASGDDIQCDSVCGKLLACGQHNCSQICHDGECHPCEITISQECFCGDAPRDVPCGTDVGEKCSCGKECARLFNCGIHKCLRKCHPNECGECATSVLRITHCPCGKRSLKELNTTRMKCTDPIPTCDAICNKVLECGSQGKPHRCAEKCHQGPCPPCTNNTVVVCRCGGSKIQLPCEEYLNIMRTSGEFLCTKRCKKRKSCGLHKCQEVCCVQDEHFCLQICNKRLSCGIHNCEHICHAGNCPRCLQASFEEQYCHCGKTVRMPPIACGQKPPECVEKCARPHPCDHPVNHNCHSEVICPPCTVLTKKWCYGKHEMRANVPCHIPAVSCGVRCNKRLSCGVHSCTRTCHGDDCEKAGEVCKKPCESIRDGCEHPCALVCHGSTPCAPSPCLQKVRITCECGRIKKNYACYEVDKLINMKETLSEDATDGVAQLSEPKRKRTSSLSQLNCLECDDECKKLERNKKVADGLGIEIDEFGESTTSPSVMYPSYLKDVVKTNMEFVRKVESVFQEIFSELSDPTKESDVARYHTPPLNVDKRRFIHEYATYFNIDTESVDSPPKRSMVLYGYRSKSRPPFVLLSQLVNYKGVLDTPGPSCIRKDQCDENKRIIEKEEGMRLLRSEKIVYKREPKPIMVISKPAPIQHSNKFAVLRSDNDDDDDEAEEKREPAKDWWDEQTTQNQEESAEESALNSEEWTEVKPKSWVVEVLVEDTGESKEGTWEDEKEDCPEESPKETNPVESSDDVKNVLKSIDDVKIDS
ncbi:unnamed protein product [Caenorhabditis bovis]|uniref:R3H domain-containing protein n=1 Tax=Caenorhabditis bovis TaxID=2654633 RepID=A0A8S1EKF8_9PELO|nr:unnamed protein product [Caenorhabditis bovis]